jgi:hypothetical protein
MAIRLLGSLGTVALNGVAVLFSHPVAAQQQGAAPPLVITAFGEQPDTANPRCGCRRAVQPQHRSFDSTSQSLVGRSR